MDFEEKRSLIDDICQAQDEVNDLYDQLLYDNSLELRYAISGARAKLEALEQIYEEKKRTK